METVMIWIVVIVSAFVAGAVGAFAQSNIPVGRMIWDMLFGGEE